MYDHPYAIPAVHRLRILLIRADYRHYYGKDGAYIMNPKLAKTLLSVGGTLLMGVATVINNKVADDKMKETIKAEVEKALENQVKES